MAKSPITCSNEACETLQGMFWCLGPFFTRRQLEFDCREGSGKGSRRVHSYPLGHGLNIDAHMAVPAD